MADHKYNDPTLSPLAFLDAVFHDPSVSLHLRTKAADAAARLRTKVADALTSGGSEPTLTIRVSTIIPGQPDTIELYRDLLYIKRCYETGTDPNILDDTPADKNKIN